MSEQFYDEEIAPALLAIGAKLEARGMSMVATVEYVPGERGSTLILAPDACLEMRMIWMLAQAAPNVDSFMIALSRYCERYSIPTDSSIYMSRFKA